MKSYRPHELFDERGKFREELAALAPTGHRRMGSNPHANGGELLVPLSMPHFRDHAIDPRRGDAHSRGLPPRCDEAQPRQAEFPPVRSGRDRIEPAGGGLRSRRQGMDGSAVRHPGRRHRPRRRRPRHGSAERAYVRGLAGGLPAHRPARPVLVLRSLHPHHRFDVQSTCEMAQGRPDHPMAQADRFVELPADLACLAPGSQRVFPPGSRLHRSCREQEVRRRADLSAARRKLPVVGRGSLPAKS